MGHSMVCHRSKCCFRWWKLYSSRGGQLLARAEDRDIRIIVHRAPATFTLCYVDHHDEAYRWAETRKVEAHPQTGAAQIVEVVERVEEIVRQVIREVEPPLLGQHSKDYLLALGVPVEWVDAVRACSESQLLELMTHLPQEVQERLLNLAAGNAVPLPVREEGVSPFAHPDAQRRFRIIDGQEELRRALDYPWEQWIVFLHPAQRSIVERQFKAPARVSGAAGTGKSVVAMHRVQQLLRKNETGRVLLTTFSRTLAGRLAQGMGLLVGEQDRLIVDHLHKVARDLWVERYHGTFQPVAANDLRTWIDEANTSVGGGSFSSAFVRAEWDAVIDPWGVSTWEEYRAFPRSNRGTALGARQRKTLWRVFEKVFDRMAESNVMTWSGLCDSVAVSLDAGGSRPFCHVVVDEAQDFGPAEMRLIRALVEHGQDDILLCGDAGQRIYKAKFSWLSAGIDVCGRATVLQVNYRTTQQIRGFADGLLAGETQEADTGAESRENVSLLQGTVPAVRSFESSQEEVAAIAEWLQQCLSEGYEPSQIAIFARTDNILRDRAARAAALAGIECHSLTDDSDVPSGRIAIGTMHRAKGLEFRAVAVVGCDDAHLPRRHVLQGFADDADRDEFTEQERQLLYVACTRARERMLVTATAPTSMFLAQSGRSGQADRRSA